MTSFYIKLLLITSFSFVMVACSPEPENHQVESGEAVAQAHHHSAPGDQNDDHGRGEHANVDRHDEDEHADDEDSDIHLNQNQFEELGIVISPVDHGDVDEVIELFAEVGFDQTQLAHVSPRVSGVVRSVSIAEGDQVAEGDILAVLDSRQLAAAKAMYLSAQSRLDLAESSFRREERLWERQISAEQDFLDARRALEDARIDVRSASQQLAALGIDVAALSPGDSSTEVSLTRYELTAPISGTVIERHAVLGEVLEEAVQPPAFIIANTNTVWIDAAVYGPDLGRLHAGANAAIDVGDGGEMIEATIDFVSPHIEEQTRTGRARIVIENAGERLRPGMFVTAYVRASNAASAMRVPVSAIQSIGEETVVFVRTEHGFEPREVRIGRRDDQYAEIITGVDLGEMIATSATFSLKSELQKGEFDDGHAH